MRVMLDNSIPGHSQLCDWAMGPQGPLFGPVYGRYEVLGIRRKAPDPNPAFQAEIDCLLTVGRLIREGRVEAFTYSELDCERDNQFIGSPMLDALAECRIQRCPSAVERSRFLVGRYTAFARKGGKRDRKKGLDCGLSQIAFMEMLCDLTGEAVSQIVSWRESLGLTEFEAESFENLSCFQQICRFSGSIENYPDMFHLWTAQRNKIDVFLTLDNRMANIGKAIAKSRSVSFEYPTQLLRPSDLLRILGITRPDPMPVPQNRFYTLTELWGDCPRARFALFRLSPRLPGTESTAAILSVTVTPPPPKSVNPRTSSPK